MKKISSLFAAAAFLLLFSFLNRAVAEKLEPIIIEDGGTGPYKAVALGEETLPRFTIYRPSACTVTRQCNKTERGEPT